MLLRENGPTFIPSPRIRKIHQDWFDRAAETQVPYPDFLRGLLQEELPAREDNQLRRGSRTPP